MLRNLQAEQLTPDAAAQEFRRRSIADPTGWGQQLVSGLQEAMDAQRQRVTSGAASPRQYHVSDAQPNDPGHAGVVAMSVEVDGSILGQGNNLLRDVMGGFVGYGAEVPASVAGQLRTGGLAQMWFSNAFDGIASFNGQRRATNAPLDGSMVLATANLIDQSAHQQLVDANGRPWHTVTNFASTQHNFGGLAAVNVLVDGGFLHWVSLHIGVSPLAQFYDGVNMGAAGAVFKLALDRSVAISQAIADGSFTPDQVNERVLNDVVWRAFLADQAARGPEGIALLMDSAMLTAGDAAVSALEAAHRRFVPPVEAVIDPADLGPFIDRADIGGAEQLVNQAASGAAPPGDDPAPPDPGLPGEGDGPPELDPNAGDPGGGDPGAGDPGDPGRGDPVPGDPGFGEGDPVGDHGIGEPAGRR